MKTIQEAAQEYAAQETRVTRSEHVAFVAGVEFAQRWISVEEELPEINRPVITRTGDYITGDIRIACAANAYADNGEFSHRYLWNYVSGEKLKDVQFWRYIELK